MMEYFTHKKSKSPAEHAAEAKSHELPVLTEEDEAFLAHITSEDTPPPLPARPQDLSEAGSTRGNDAQIALMNGAQDIPLPDVPDTPDGVLVAIEGDHDDRTAAKGKEKDRKKYFGWSFLRRDSRHVKRRDQVATATDLQSVAVGLKSPNAKPNEDGLVTPNEAHKEEEEMTAVLEQLNLAAINNRVFSISKESQELLRKFTLVLKDLVNGVPTAFQDLESLLTNSEQQLQKSYKHLPDFLQKLIEQLPSKFTGSFGPEILATMAEKQGLKSEYATQAAGVASKMGMKVKVPNLKDLVTKPGAVAGMLRAIMNFLKLRFPAFMGMNVLLSLALFVLLFVFWYCHKRGREVRLEQERLVTEAELAAIEAEIAAANTDASSSPEKPPPPTSAHPITTAAEGASIQDVREGMLRATMIAQEGGSGSGGDGGVGREGAATYAPGGSLGKEMAREREEEEERKKTGKGI